MPPVEHLQNHRLLRHLGDALHDSNLWHINRHSAASAVAIGLFCAFMPIPLQMLLAATLAIGLHANLPVAVAVVWVSNPLTMAPMLYAAYRLGAIIMDLPVQPIVLHLDIASWLAEIRTIWKPLLLGCLLCGLLASALGYTMVKLGWRAAVTYQWRKRGQDRRANSRRKCQRRAGQRRSTDRRTTDRRARRCNGSNDTAHQAQNQPSVESNHLS